MSLAKLITAESAKGAAKAAVYIAEFKEDASFLVTANNEQRLLEAIAALPVHKVTGKVNSEQFAILGDAIGKACKALREALPDGCGWIGAKNGAFNKATKEARAPYLRAHTVAVDTFAGVLASSPLWRDLTEDEKTQKAEERKAKKEAKAEEARAEEAAKVAAIRAALIKSGELVTVEALPLTLGSATAVELVGALATLLDEGASLPLEALRDLLAKAEAKKAEEAPL